MLAACRRARSTASSVDPVIARLLTPTALRRWTLLWWAAAFAVGAYAGAQISYAASGPSSWGVVGVFIAGTFWVAWTGAFVAIAALLAVFLHRVLLKGRLPSAMTVLVFAALYATGVAVGFVLWPMLG